MEEIKKIAEEFFGTLGIQGDVIVNEKDDHFEIVLETEESGMVIGHHGETLEALQLLLSLAISKRTGEFKRVSLEVGDYKKNRSEWLEKLAQDTKDKALAENREVHLYDLKGWERRVIHLLFQDDQDVTSESMGEGKERVLVVKPR